MFEKPQQPNEKKETTMKKISTLKKLGKAVALSASLLIGAENAEAGKDDMFKELDNEVNNMQQKKESDKKVSPNIVPDKKGGDMFESMDKLGSLDEKYASAKTEQEKDVLRQQIAKEVLMSGKSGKILSQKDGSVSNMRVGGWTITARSDGKVVTGSIVSHNGNEKSMFAFTLR